MYLNLLSKYQAKCLSSSWFWSQCMTEISASKIVTNTQTFLIQQNAARLVIQSWTSPKTSLVCPLVSDKFGRAIKSVHKRVWQGVKKVISIHQNHPQESAFSPQESTSTKSSFSSTRLIHSSMSPNGWAPFSCPFVGPDRPRPRFAQTTAFFRGFFLQWRKPTCCESAGSHPRDLILRWTTQLNCTEL